MQIVLAQHIVMRMKYVYQRNGVSYYQRQIPKDLRDRYPTSGPIKINLETNDCVVVGSKVAKLNKQYEALWAAMRKDPSLSPEKTQDEAKKLLKRFGVELRGDSPEANLEGLYDFLEAKRLAHADRQPDPEEAYRFASDSEYLSKTEQTVVKLLQGKEEFLLSDALDFYLNEHPKRGRLTFPKLEEDARRVWGKLTALLGDKIFTEVTRDHARLFRDSLMGALSTGSVRRSLNTVCAVFRFAIKERTIQGHNNVFEGVTIAGEGLDTRKRESLDADQLKLLREKCLAADEPDSQFGVSICTPITAYFGVPQDIDGNVRQFREGLDVILCILVFEEVACIPFAKLASRLGHVDEAILPEDDGEAFEVFGDGHDGFL